jgi:hypothetical protein
LALTAGGLLALPSAGAQATPGEDSVAGTSVFMNGCPTKFDCGAVTQIDAHSGPSGENPSGRVAVTILVSPAPGVIEPGPTFDLQVICLNVQGNRASVGATGTIGPFVIDVQDNGVGGQDGFAVNTVPTVPTQCPDPPSLGGTANADFTVHDAFPSAPSILSTTPPDGFSGASRLAPIVVNFDQAMDRASVEAAFSLKRTSNGEPVSGSFNWNGNALSFTPYAPLAPSRLFTARIGTDARNLGGIHLAAPVAWTFSTTPQPLIAFVTPADQATNVSRGAIIVVGFDTAMDKPSAQAAFSLVANKTGTPVTGAYGWFGNALLFQPSADLAANTFYLARERNTAKNLAGRPLASGRTWGFTTGP